MYPTASPAAWQTVLLKEQPGQLVYALYAGSPTGGPGVYYNVASTDTGQRGLSGPTPLPLNTWSHLAATYDGATLALYVNGTLVASQASTGTLIASSGALRLGGNTIWSTESFPGRLDEVQLYNRALTLAELQSAMTTPLSR